MPESNEHTVQWICLFNFHFIYSLWFITLSNSYCYFLPDNLKMSKTKTKTNIIWGTKPKSIMRVDGRIGCSSSIAENQLYQDTWFAEQCLNIQMCFGRYLGAQECISGSFQQCIRCENPKIESHQESSSDFNTFDDKCRCLILALLVFSTSVDNNNISFFEWQVVVAIYSKIWWSLR